MKEEGVHFENWCEDLAMKANTQCLRHRSKDWDVIFVQHAPGHSPVFPQVAVDPIAEFQR